MRHEHCMEIHREEGRVMATYRIFKYPVSLTDDVVVEMPESAEVLGVQVQQGKAVMWALVDPDASAIARRFRLVGTGHPINGQERYQLRYVGTFQLAEGSLVFHLFEVA